MGIRVALEDFPRPLEKKKVSKEARERFNSEDVHRSSYLKPYFLHPEALAYQ